MKITETFYVLSFHTKTSSLTCLTLNRGLSENQVCFKYQLFMAGGLKMREGIALNFWAWTLPAIQEGTCGGVRLGCWVGADWRLGKKSRIW